MSDSQHIVHLLDDYLDGLLSADEQHVVERHLSSCASCKTEWVRLEELVRQLKGMPDRIEPEKELWQAIDHRISKATAASDRRPAPGRAPVRRRQRQRRYSSNGLIIAGIALLLLATGSIWFISAYWSWDVDVLAGMPRIEQTSIAEAGELREGEWLETDEASRARLRVGRIGNVEIEPGTRLQLQSTEVMNHRLKLNAGRIHARIWAPPRLFFVETPAGMAIDLGCEYTLDVDGTGNSRLHVLSGYVSFAAGSREVVVPAGWRINARPGRFTGTPYSDSATPALLEALERFDFESGGPEAIDDILREVRPQDALTIWELLWHARRPERERIYDRLVELTSPPAGVTRAGVLQKDAAMITAWRKQLGVNSGFWLSALKKKKKMFP